MISSHIALKFIVAPTTKLIAFYCIFLKFPSFQGSDSENGSRFYKYYSDLIVPVVGTRSKHRKVTKLYYHVTFTRPRDD
ncbi:uncharacterized protein RAG0_00359 [Rhynchosporium agropyri]|uniref:Uncharacterized protein n=1 Tax=Rhynchosporium agropyri TaxID=914238 RepID=A0A1E1JSE9_9HELO|nr:uncharacterized protein RAG0_00359 [Rhynchosporium agropyri]